MDETTSRAGLSAVLVQRVSKLASDRERSVADQEAENRAECARFGWRIAESYSQQQSASRFARSTGRRKTWAQAWAQLTSDVAAGTYGVVVMWESSRGDRTPETWFRFLAACRDTRTLIHVKSHGRTYDMRNWRDWRTLAEDGVDNAAESEKISERVNRGIRANVTSGRPHGKVPYGYERVYDERTRKLLGQRPHPEQAPIVREIKERIAAGVPVRTLMRDLNERGVPTKTGVPWSHQVIRQIAINPVYISRRLWRGDHGDGEAHPGNWPAIVSEETHYAAVAMLTGSERIRRPARNVYLLSFVAQCAVCERFLQGNQDSGVMPGYRCPTGCCMTRVPWLDAFISRLVIRKLSEPETYAQLTSDGGEAHRAARADVARLRAQLDEAAGSYAEQKIGIATLESIERKLRPQLEKAEKRAAELAVAAPLRSLLMTPREDIAARWKDMEVAQRKAAVRALFEWIKLKPGQPGAPRGVRAKFDPSRVDWEWRKGPR